MSESDLPLAELSQHSPRRRLKYWKSPLQYLATIAEEDAIHHDSGGAPVSIYEDLSNYESLEDGDYDLGLLPPHKLTCASLTSPQTRSTSTAATKSTIESVLLLQPQD